MFSGSFKGVSRKFQGCFIKVSKMFHKSFKDEEVSRKFRRCFMIFKGVSRVFQGSFKIAFKVFQKSFTLHGTHRSFPSRRRACFYRIRRDCKGVQGSSGIFKEF